MFLYYAVIETPSFNLSEVGIPGETDTLHRTEEVVDAAATFRRPIGGFLLSACRWSVARSELLSTPLALVPSTPAHCARLDSETWQASPAYEGGD